MIGSKIFVFTFLPTLASERFALLMFDNIIKCITMTTQIAPELLLLSPLFQPQQYVVSCINQAASRIVVRQE